MRVEVEFYRTRVTDKAHATVGRETIEATDADHAIVLALEMSRTLNMPQRPDAFVITDELGNQLHSILLEPDVSAEEPPHA